MKIKVVSLAADRKEWFKLVQAEYESKISYLYPFQVVHLSTRKAPREQGPVKAKWEEDQLLAHLDDRDYVALCDEWGKTSNSLDFSARLVRAISSGKKDLAFVIGGAYGFGDRLKKRADWQFTLAPFTLNHLVAEIVLFEQVYRGLCIWKNTPYHND